MKKKFLRLLVVLLCTPFLFINHAESKDKLGTVEITIGSRFAIINGQKQLSTDLPFFIEKGKTMAPIRFFPECFGLGTTTENLGKLAKFKGGNKLPGTDQ